MRGPKGQGQKEEQEEWIVISVATKESTLLVAETVGGTATSAAQVKLEKLHRVRHLTSAGSNRGFLLAAATPHSPFSHLTRDP